MGFNILIVDDERFIRKGIITILERDLEEEIQCFEGKNGIEALAVLQQEKIDLIITDISMPGCDGLEFISQIRQINENLTVIILSGYENFDYAKKAISLGVKEYIMKPIKKQDFLNTIKSYVYSIKKVRNQSEAAIIRGIERRKLVEKLKHDLLVDLLECEDGEAAGGYIANLRDLGMSFSSSLFTCAVMQYEVLAENADFIDFVVKNVTDEYLNMQQDSDLILTVKYNYGKLVIIFESINGADTLRNKVKLLKKTAAVVAEHSNTRIFIGLGDVALDPLQLHRSLRHALAVSSQKIYGTAERVAVYEKQKQPRTGANKIANLAAKLKPIELLDTIGFLNDVDKLINAPRENQSLKDIQREYEAIKECLEEDLQYCQIDQPGNRIVMKDFEELWSFQALKKELKENIERKKKLVKESGGEISNRKLMAEIIAFVQDNITGEIDLNMVAAEFNRSPGYISTLFKRRAKIGFNSYVTNEKIKIARKLLSDPAIPIQRVSELCGYPNAKYFSVVFKKVVGDTPKNYRNNNINH